MKRWWRHVDNVDLLIQLSCWINAKILGELFSSWTKVCNHSEKETGQLIKLNNQLDDKWSKSVRVKCVWGGPESLQIDGQRSTFHSSVMTWIIRIQTRDLIWRNEFGSMQKSSNGFSSIILSHHFSMKNQSGVAHTVVAARENVVPGGKSIRLDCWVNGGYLRDEVNQVISMGICKANQLAHYWLPIFPTKTSLPPTQDIAHCWSFKLQVVLFLWHSLTS